MQLSTAFLGLVSLPMLLGLGCSSESAPTALGAGGSSSSGGAKSGGSSATSQPNSSGGSVASGGSSSMNVTSSASNSGGSNTNASSASGGSNATSASSQGSGGSSPSASGSSKPTTGGSSSPSAGGKSGSGVVQAGSKATGGQPATGGIGGAPTTGGAVAAAGSKTTGGSTAAGTANAVGGAASITTVVIGTPQSGEITFYDDVGDGTCSYGVTGETDVAALGQASWDNAAWCGACADVTGPKGTVRVRVVNKCPSCGGAGDLDLNKSAFLKIQDEKVGRFKVTWNYVACDVTGPVQYKFKEGSSPGWTAIMVTNTRLPITKLEWSTNKSSWTAMQRQDYNYFLEPAGVGQDPIYVRITALGGQQLIDRMPMVEEFLVVKGAANFE